MSDSDPKEIYLEPIANVDPQEGRLWCQYDVWSDDDYPDMTPTRYIREDVAQKEYLSCTLENTSDWKSRLEPPTEDGMLCEITTRVWFNSRMPYTLVEWCEGEDGEPGYFCDPDDEVCEFRDGDWEFWRPANKSVLPEEPDIAGSIEDQVRGDL